MTGKVVQLRPRQAAQVAPTPRPAPRISGECYLLAGQDGGWVVVDVSASGDSAGWHSWHADRAEAVGEGRRVAAELGRRFLDDEIGGAA